MTSAPLISVLPLRDIVVFPGMIVPLFVGREKSVKALEDVATVEQPPKMESGKIASVLLTPLKH